MSTDTQLPLLAEHPERPWVVYNVHTATYDTPDGTRVPAELIDNVHYMADVLHIADIRTRQRAAIEAYRTSREGEAVVPYWLIECGHSLSLGWWTGTGTLKCVLFSPDPTLARRFATREAAEAEISAHGNSCMIVTEHLDVATHPADQTQAEQAKDE